MKSYLFIVRINIIIKKCKQQCFSDLINRHKNNNVSMWKVPKNIIFEKQSQINKLPDVFIDNNREYKEDEITEGLTTFFTNIGSNLAKRMTLKSESFFDTLPISNCNSMMVSGTNAKEILSIVKRSSQISHL